MQIYKLPTINEKLMSFHLEFIGTDKLGGERHYLEHMMLNSNSTFTKDQLHRQLTSLGGELFNACTSQERIMFSGTYLKKDEQVVWELLKSILNGCYFLEDEIEKERNIILEEFRMGKDQIFKQLYVSLGKVLDQKLCVVGNEDSIKGIGQYDLKTVYSDLIQGNRATMFIDNCYPPESLFESHPNGHNHLKPIVPKGDHEIENDQMSSSVVFHTFDQGFSLSALLLKDYLQSSTGPLFKNIREKRQLCYMTGAMTDFAGDFKLSPYFTTYVVSNSNINSAGEALMEEFVVNDVELYDCLRVKQELEIEEFKSTFNGQMSLRRRSILTGFAADSLVESIPSWKEFKAFAAKVKETHLGSFKVIGTKR